MFSIRLMARIHCIAFLLCLIPLTYTHANSPVRYDIRTGVNVSHWLSQSQQRGEARRTYITRQDFKKIAAMGFDHVRLPLDEVQLVDEKGKRHEDAFQLMHNAIRWAFEFDLKVIVDLHIIRSHYFLSKNNTIWTDAKAQQQLIKLWRDLSAELKQYPTDKLAYEVLNEAVADKHEDWNRISSMLIDDIRKREKKRFIVLGSNRWQGPETFPYLKIPENDPYIILSFHFYTPNALTHNQASWTDFAEYTGPVSYPGVTVDPKAYANLSQKTINAMGWASGYYDKKRLEELIQPAIKVAKKSGLQLYCGEFGSYPKAPKDDSMRWYNDLVDIFNKHNISRSHWSYKGDFSVLDGQGNPKKALVKALVK